MRSIFKHIILLALAISVYAQQTPDSISVSGTLADSVKVNAETPAAVLSDEEKLCKEVAEDIIKIYDSWSPERDYKILYPRVKGFVDDFFAQYPDFDFKVIQKDKLGEKLNDYELRSFVAFKGTKNDKIFEEVSRFITTKDFYWGYISKELDESINKAADKLKKYTLSRKDTLLADQAEYVESLLLESRKYERQLDSIKAMPDEKVIDDLLSDENYNNEMMAIEFKIDSAKTKPEVQAVLERLYRDKDQRILDHIFSKRKELIENKRAEKIDAKDWWVEEKRQTIFDLYELENARLSDLVYGFITPLEEERSITSFDINDELLLSFLLKRLLRFL